MKFCVIPSFFPIIAVTVEERAKLAPKFAPKLVAFETPDVEAIAFVTALPSVFAIDVPVVFATVFEMVLVIPFVNWIVELVLRWEHFLLKKDVGSLLVALLATFGFGVLLGWVDAYFEYTEDKICLLDLEVK